MITQDVKVKIDWDEITKDIIAMQARMLEKCKVDPIWIGTPMTQADKNYPTMPGPDESMSGVALAKSLGYDGGGDGGDLATLPPCEPGYRYLKTGENGGANEYWNGAGWIPKGSTITLTASHCVHRVKLPTGGVVTPTGYADAAQRILDRHPPVAITTHHMRFGRTVHTLEVSKGLAIARPALLGSSIWEHRLNIAALSPDLPVETVRALILDHLGIERIADTAKAQDAEQQRTTRTQYGPGTMGEWEVNL